MFISLEGIDRSGKTTQATLLAAALGPETLLLREPGGTPLGERVRDILKDASLELSAATELLLFSAARAELAGNVIGPAVEAGRDVVCDRFIDSTTAYQGAGRELGIEHVEQFNQVVIAGCVPDLTLYLRVDPRRAQERGHTRAAAGHADGSDRFEAEGIELQRVVARAYDEIAARHPERIVVIDGSGDTAVVHARIMDAVSAR